MDEFDSRLRRGTRFTQGFVGVSILALRSITCRHQRKFLQFPVFREVLRRPPTLTGLWDIEGQLQWRRKAENYT
jgi:hypothetical protein